MSWAGRDVLKVWDPPSRGLEIVQGEGGGGNYSSSLARIPPHLGASPLRGWMGTWAVWGFSPCPSGVHLHIHPLFSPCSCSQLADKIWDGEGKGGSALACYKKGLKDLARAG